jgi:UDP-N-acetyl-alpha-D-muramoyl-L-alanyl-L-glutamate epimerase
LSDSSVYEAFDVDGTAVRFRYRWGDHQAVYKLQVQGDGPLAPPDPALAFRVGLGLAPYFFSFLTPDRLLVRAGPLPPDEAARWERWYTLGLAEKCYRLGLDPGTHVTCEPASEVPVACSAPAAGEGLLLMNGGGKDTAVAAELLREAGVAFRWLTVNEKPAQRELREASGVPGGIQVKGGWEKLPPVASFRYQGQPPVLLFYDLAALLAAHMSGVGAVAVANERSADYGNLQYRGLEVNHQYTKSDAFETELAAWSCGPLRSGVRFYSPLRPLYELQVAQVFASLRPYHARFMSCNVGQTGGRKQWCGKCPKCAFAALILSPFLPAADALAIFGRDFLDDAALLPTYLEIAGLEGHKPLECVGRPEEALAAVQAWPAGRPLPLAVRELRARVPEERRKAAASEVLDAWGPPGLIPEELRGPLAEAYRTLRARG